MSSLTGRSVDLKCPTRSLSQMIGVGWLEYLNVLYDMCVFTFFRNNVEYFVHRREYFMLICAHIPCLSGDITSLWVIYLIVEFFIQFLIIYIQNVL